MREGRHYKRDRKKDMILLRLQLGTGTLSLLFSFYYLKYNSGQS
jgi:hypothetical protein